MLGKHRTRYIFKIKIKRIKKSIKEDITDSLIPGEKDKGRYLKLWRPLSRKVRLDWLEVYTAVSGRSDWRYVPEDVYYNEIEPRLNNKLYSKAWTDKNSYELLLGNNIKVPEALLRSIGGFLYTFDFRPLGKTNQFTILPPLVERKLLVIKPTMDSGGGKAVRLFSATGIEVDLTPKERGINTLADLFNQYSGNFIIQSYIKQHHWFARFNESSLNTVRILTYRSVASDEVTVLHCLLRAGAPGSVTDNQASGGIVCAVSLEGELSTFGVDKHGKRHTGTESLEFRNAGTMPFITKIMEAALRVASAYRYSRLLGLDFAIDTAGEVILIEVNDTNNEINFYQMTSGPLFGSFTTEVAEECKTMPRSFLIDYIV